MKIKRDHFLHIRVARLLKSFIYQSIIHILLEVHNFFGKNFGNVICLRKLTAFD